MDDHRIIAHADFQRIARVIDYVGTHWRDQPSLEEMARVARLSKFHFQRLFRRWAGVSPSQFVHYLTVEFAKQRLRESASVLETTLDAGLSSPSRLHDLLVTFDAVTPGEFSRNGRGVVMRYGVHESPFGRCLIAVTPRGLCRLAFLDAQDRDDTLHELQGDWPEATLVQSSDATQPYVQRIFDAARASGDDRRIHLHLKGTNFQVNVWRALLAIPPGALAAYQDIAARLGRPEAHRAVAQAIAHNPIGYLIPCHRVIARTGELCGYRWGRTRKQAIIAWEAAHAREAVDAGEVVEA